MPTGTCKMAVASDWCETLAGGLTLKHVDQRVLGGRALQEMADLRARLLPRLNAGTVTRDEMVMWGKLTFKKYVEAGLTRQRAEQALENFHVRPGAREMLELARERGAPVAIISGSCADFIQIVLNREGLLDLVSEIHAARLIWDGDRAVGVHDETLVHNFNKGEIAQGFASRHDVPEEGIVGIGDSHNDARLAGPRGYLVGLAPTEELAAKIRDVFHEVYISVTLHPVVEAVRRRWS